MRKILVALVVLPLSAFAQGPGAAPGAAPGGGPNVERMEKRMRLARTLGLAEALDLDAPQALKLGETIAKFDDRRVAAHRQLRDAAQVLRRAAQGEKVQPAEVDQAIQKGLDARAQLQAIDRELVTTITQGLTPEKKARAVLFLARFHHRFGPPPGMGRGMGMEHGHGMGAGRGPGGPGGGMGMGPGEMGPMGMTGPGPEDDACPGCAWEDGE